MSLVDTYPIVDTTQYFQYGRVFAESFLVEDADSQQWRSPILISIIRHIKETVLTAIVVSQNGALRLCIQEDKSWGPTWSSVTWNVASHVLTLRLPRGFTLHLQCTPQDFMTLRGLYDYQRSTHASLIAQQDEKVIFETTAKSVQ
jgi:hypothetical protein